MPEPAGLELMLAPIRVVAFTVAALGSSWTASWLARRFGGDPAWARNTTLAGILLGLAAARLAHAAANWLAYSGEPWRVLYLWQPGYLPVAGLAAGALFVLLRLAFLPAPQRLRSVRPVVTGLAVGAVVLTVAYGGARWWAESGVLRAGDELPRFNLVDLHGEPVSREDLAGKAVVLNFWATWCPPCRREMPLLESVWREYRDRGVEVIGIAVGQSSGEVRPFVDSTGVGYPIWLGRPPSEGNATGTWDMLEWFGSAGLPTTVFIGKDGVIRHVRLGELERGPLMEQLSAMAGPP